MLKKRKTITIVILGIAIMLITTRLILPHFVLKFINKQLGNLNGYIGHVDDVDLHLYRGAYVIHHLVIERTKGKMRQPFLNVKSIDLSIQWSAILHGRIVGEVSVKQPVLNFAIDSSGTVKQMGNEHNWGSTIRKLTPLNIKLNRFLIQNGTIQYSDYSQAKDVRLYFDSLQLLATNLSNVVDTSSDMPSEINIKANTIGNGRLKIVARANAVTDPPDFDVNIELVKLQLTGLKNFTQSYANFDFDAGELSVFSEILMKNGRYEGYIKPLFEEMRILQPHNDKSNGLLRNAWEGLLTIFSEGLENQPKNRFASKTPIKGNLVKSDVGLWMSFINILKNAFIEAIPKSLDHSIGRESKPL